MAKGLKALIKPELLVWARKSAGLSIEAASKSITTPEKLKLWEDGETSPTVRQLSLLANKYKRPLSVFYLPEPPTDFQALKDFRRLPDVVAGVYSPQLIYEIRAAHERREIALELYEDLNEPIPTFDLRADRRRNPETLGMQIREYLGVGFDEQRSWRDARAAYNNWRNLIEAAGVLVFQASRIEIGEMRGFAIAEDKLPVIAVNSKDHPNGRTFSLLHELCHLILHESALTDFSIFNADELRPPETREIEIYCNRVSAAALMPEQYFLNEQIIQGHGASHEWDDEDLYALARLYSVSPEAVLRRLLYFGKTSERFYNQKRAEFLERYKRLAEKQKENAGGPPPHLRALGNLGSSFSKLVLQNYYSKHITLNDVAGYLGLKVQHVYKLAHETYGRDA